jgi:molybdopterin-guanine dinucleotide biosynthesis protein A
MTSKENSIPSLNGLVLAGGKSRRMGRDKDLIAWHGKAQRYYAADMLKDFCEEVFISCRPGQAVDIDTPYKALPDTFLDMGPYGGILSALRAHREKAWLVVACDLPLLTTETLGFLVAHRDIHKMATSYQSPYDGLPEPLVAIWEPESYPALLRFLGQGISCPRKALINSDITLLQAVQPESLMNVNTVEDAEQARAILHKNKAGMPG